MSDLEKPILFVAASREDYSAKPGGGGTPDPLVPITPGLRRQLDAQLAVVEEYAQMAGDHTAAMIVTLREAAYAKSNRPNALFARLGIPVVAARHIGELIVPAIPEGLRQLRNVVSEANTKVARFQISTIGSFSLWSAGDVLRSPEGVLTPAEVGSAIRGEHRFRLEFFPWIDSEEDFLVAELSELHVERSMGSQSRRAIYFRAETPAAVMRAASVSGVRHICIEPEFSTPSDFSSQTYLQVADGLPSELGNVPATLPTLGVLDSGVLSAALAPYVVGRIEYELPGDTDYSHGTFVAGLASAGKILNSHLAGFPDDRSKIFDAVVLPTGSIAEADLIYRVRDAVSRNPEIKVWNCSFGANEPNQPPEFGLFARELDRMSEEFGVLFVVAAGNYGSQFIRGWPAEQGHFPGDRISMPSEAVRALSVGALAPLDCFVGAGCPAPYSRRGPGPAYNCKPEVVHFGGGISDSGAVDGGVRSLLPGDGVYEGVGTSFSTPLISTIAANAWATLEASGRDVDPALVKALVVHAAALNSEAYSAEERNYYGFGVPSSSVDSMFCDPAAFTTLFAVDLERGVDWDKSQFPIPACLVTDSGALRAEIIMTLCYSPPLAEEFGDEYVQHEVDASFGSFDVDPEDPPNRKHHGLVPLERPVGADTREVAMLKEALKYSPTKVYRAKFPRGRTAEQWRVKLSLTPRKETVENVRQRVYLLVTLRGLEPDLPVYLDGVRAVPNNWLSNELVNRATIRQRLR
jgi:hypothetical protein